MSVSPQWLSTQTSPNIRSGSVDIGRQPNLNFGSGFTVTSDPINYQNTITVNTTTTGTLASFTTLTVTGLSSLQAVTASAGVTSAAGLSVTGNSYLSGAVHITGNMLTDGTVTTTGPITSSLGMLVNGPITSSVGSFGMLSTIGNNNTGQTLSTANVYVPIQQWLTGAITTAGVVATPTGSITINASGMYHTAIAMSFSGSVGIYTFQLFKNNVADPNMAIQASVPQTPGTTVYPFAVAMNDLNYFVPGDIIDVRVKCSTANVGFQMSYGQFLINRFVG